MESGKLRHILTIQKNVPVIDSYGSRVDAWQDVATVRGSIMPLSGREFFAAQQTSTEIKLKAVIRYGDGDCLDHNMRILHCRRVGKSLQSVRYSIIFVQNIDMRNRKVVLWLSQEGCG